ncbi:MAG: hypothetical protein JKY19_01760 [Alcanivoracaceae bacterium]|nr:hypothetical protein [Alcanivoracaceae bacterium]
MSPYELLDLALSLSNRIDTHWALFISVHLALIGGIIYVDRPLTKKGKTAAIIIYSGFAAINYFMMKGQAVFLNSIYQQIDSIKDDLCCKDNHVIAHVTNLYEFGVSSALSISIIAVHVVMFIVIILSIFFDKKLPKGDENNKTS